MRLEVLDTVDPGAWDELVAQLGGVIGHSTTYARYYLAGQPNARAQYFRWLSDGGTVCGAAIGLELQSPHKILASWTRRLCFPTTPQTLCCEGGSLSQFLDAILTHARQSGIMELEIASSASTRGGEELERLGFSLTRRLEFELSLERSEDELWDNMEYKRQKNIRKAQRMEVAIRDCNEDGIVALRQVQAESSKRITARGGRDIAYQGSEASDPVRVLLDSGLARIVCAEVAGEIVSAGLFTRFNDLVYHTLSGHSRRALETQAPTLLLWEMIKRYRAEGAKRLNFGGCTTDCLNESSPEHGVYVYKKAFGAECVACTSGRKILRKHAHGLMRCLKGAFGRPS